MTRRDSRRRLSTGIYTDDVVNYGTVHVRGAGFREKRFPLAQPLHEIQQWRERTRIALLGVAERGTKPGTFDRDAVRYLADYTQHLSSRKSRKGEIKPWRDAFGDQPRGTIKPADVSRIRLKWLASGLAPKTINNRVNALRHLYHCLDGKRAWTPCDDLEPLDVHKTPIQVVSDEVIATVDLGLQQLERQKKILSSKTRARFRVLVSTGRRPSEVMRTEPGDVNLERRVWIPRDGKGGFSPGIYLNDDMLAAWQLFIDVNAWGHFDTHLHAERLRKAGWPTDVRPYNARHTVGITLSERGVDLDDVGSMMGHKRRETTRKHYVPVLNSRMQRASETLAGRFQGWPTVQTSSKAVQTAKQTNQTKREKSRPKLTQLQTRSEAATTAGKRPVSSRTTRRKK